MDIDGYLWDGILHGFCFRGGNHRRYRGRTYQALADTYLGIIDGYTVYFRCTKFLDTRKFELYV